MRHVVPEEPIVASEAHDRRIDLVQRPAISGRAVAQRCAGGSTLVALNAQRGRDHGLANYNSARLAYGLRPRREVADITPDRRVTRRLASLYTSVDDVVAWVGALAEAPYRGLVGEPLSVAMREQLTTLRDGDRFWYRRALLPDECSELGTLADVIKRDTATGVELPDRVFRIPSDRLRTRR